MRGLEISKKSVQGLGSSQEDQETSGQKPPFVPLTGDEFAAILAAIDKYPTNNIHGQNKPSKVRADVLLRR